MIKRSRGFTIVEIMVIVVVLAILMGIVAVGVIQYQKVSRDAQRESAVTTVIEGLEKYYLANGEYPSVPALTNVAPANVAELIKVDVAVLKMPNSSAEVSIVAPGSTETDVMIYAGANAGNGANCQTDSAIGCDSFELTYEKEVGGAVTTKSRHEGGSYVTASQVPPKPTVTVQSSGGVNMEAESSTPLCATLHTAKYSFRSQISGLEWPAWSAWQTARTFTTTGIQGSTYYFQVQTRCDRDATVGVASQPSDETSFTIPAGAPTAPTLAVALSGSNVVATAGTTSCISGYTAQYSLRSRTNNGSWGAYSAWSTTRTASQAVAQGVRYGYQVQARCYSSASTSGSSTSSEVTYTHPILAPAAPTVSIAGSGTSLSFVVGAVSCPSGTSAQYQYRSGHDQKVGGFSFFEWYGAYSSPPTSSGYSQYQGGEYATEAQARCVSSFSTSPWSATGANSRIISITTPGAPTNFVSNITSDKTVLTWSWTAPSCPTGTTRNVIVYWHWNEGTPNEWHPSSDQGNYSGVATFRVEGGAPLGSGIKARASARYICINASSGRTSAWGVEASSPVFIVP